MRYFLLVLITLTMPACLMEVLTTTAIQGELQAQNASAANRTLTHAKDNQAKAQLQHGINAYTAEHGQYPSSLYVLVPDYVTSVPLQTNGQSFGYDPATGAITSGPAAQGSQGGQYPTVTPQDKKNMEMIGDAIYVYWESTGYYPASLDSLTPLYITKLPKMSTGENYWYNTQTGLVFHPGEQSQNNSGGQFSTGASSGGAGLLGETTTAIGIQNQLGNMNQGGTQSTSTRSRNTTRGISDAHSQRQMDALKDLGLQ
jgi:hypothetical protein